MTQPLSDDPGTRREMKEFAYKGLRLSGFAMIFFTFILLPALLVLTCLYVEPENEALGATLIAVLSVLIVFGLVGYFVQEPNESRVMTFFGKYVGTCRDTGFFWVNPFLVKRKVSLRIRNIDIDPIKVNDKTGNPVLIGMVLVWKIEDTYRAVFDLDGRDNRTVNSGYFERFVRIQSDAALREVAGHYAYDSEGSSSNELTLRDGGEEINDLLERKINERLAMAGMRVVEARINYLAYAPEIAAVMLRRQQATAIISAREKIVEGAVSMVSMALDRIEQQDIVKFTDDRKAALVGNLLVVLCSDEPAQPVLNADAKS